MKEYRIVIGFVIGFILLTIVIAVLIQPNIPSSLNIPQTVVLEGHDYFLLRTYGGHHTLCHKGNCSACIKGEKE
jgi:hypothetical protein